MSKLARSHIEILPDELWLEVFAYTPPLDLYMAWRNLNSHIDAILRSARINIHIRSKKNDNSHYENALRHFPLQTVHVKDERWETGTSSGSRTIDLLPLANLRSLYLTHCSQEQFKQLVNLRQLTRLSLPCDDSSRAFFEQFVFSKEGEERFPQLHSIGRIWCSVDKPKGSPSVTVNTTIRHLHLVMPSRSVTVNFIQHLPELRSITVDYLGNEAAFPSSCFIFARIRSSSQPNAQKNLSLVTIAARICYLKIDFDGQCDFVKLASLLRLCLILEQIQITVKYYPKDLNLASIRHLSPFFADFSFGDVIKETGRPVIVAKWSS